jgi:hypothetical protein
VFIARRMQVGNIASFMVVLLSGWIADAHPNLTVYCAVMTCSGHRGRDGHRVLSGSEGTAASTRPSEVQAPLLASFREPLREPAVRTFLLFLILLCWGYGR